jgi:hypothetical protein
MEHAVIAMFDDFAQAQRAKDELLKAGFQANDVQMSPSDEKEESRRSALGLREDSSENDDSGWSITKFFKSLFGTDDDTHREHADTYSEALRRGSFMVSVDADTEEQQERASAVLLNCDPVDIEGRSQAWRTQGWSGYDSSAPLYTQDDIARERQSYTATGGAAGFDTHATTASGLGAGAANGMGATGLGSGADSNMSTAPSQGSGLDTGIGSVSGAQESNAASSVGDGLSSGGRVGQGAGVRSFRRMSESPSGNSVTQRDQQSADAGSQRQNASAGYMADDNLVNSDLTGGGLSNSSVGASSGSSVGGTSGGGSLAGGSTGGMGSAASTGSTGLGAETLGSTGMGGAGMSGAGIGTEGRESSGMGSAGLGGAGAGSDSIGGAGMGAGMGAGTSAGTSGADTGSIGAGGMAGSTGGGIGSAGLGGQGLGSAGMGSTGGGMASDSATSSNLQNDDSAYRSHWQNSFASSGGRYEDYAPAYQYGSTLADDERYRGHQWNDIEPHVRTDWESRNSGSTWERAKEAVRYGWEKMTH